MARFRLLGPAGLGILVALGVAHACYYEALNLENPADFYYRLCYAGVSTLHPSLDIPLTICSARIWTTRTTITVNAVHLYLLERRLLPSVLPCRRRFSLREQLVNGVQCPRRTFPRRIRTLLSRRLVPQRPVHRRNMATTTKSQSGSLARPQPLVR
jgi:hypothetical protein